jgi:hypothetical protein
VAIVPSRDGVYVEEGKENYTIRAGNTPVRIGGFEWLSRADLISASFNLSDEEGDRASLRSLAIAIGTDEFRPVPLEYFDRLRTDFPMAPGDGERVCFSFSVMDLARPDRPELYESLREMAAPGFVADVSVKIFLSDWESEPPVFRISSRAVR